jgi:RimJ/RimL family protein N-acetyltransferase
MDAGITIPRHGAILRPWSEDDICGLARAANDPAIAATMRDGFPSPYTIDDARRFIGQATGPAPGLLLAIEIDGIVAGGIGIHPLADVYRKTAEIGYWLAVPYRGRGIATAAVGALVPLAFARFAIHRLQRIRDWSSDVCSSDLEKNGFTREAVHQKAVVKNGVVMDEVLYVLFKKGETVDQTGTTRLP